MLTVRQKSKADYRLQNTDRRSPIMAIKTYKPTTPGQRFKTGRIFDEITKKKPEKALTTPLPSKAGRNKGKISVRHHGGRVKRLYRIVDFDRKKKDVSARVLAIEYDPNRSANIALLKYEDGEKSYILAPLGLKVGEEVIASEKAEIKPGNALPLSKIPLGSQIHNIEMVAGKGGQLVRSAGEATVLMAKEEGFAHLKLPSREVRKIPLQCWATLGQVGVVEHSLIRLGKAGRARYLGQRPEVRGTAMSAGDHPHGGGKGGRGGEGRHPKTVYGKPARKKTRKKGKRSDKYIVKRRKS